MEKEADHPDAMSPDIQDKMKAALDRRCLEYLEQGEPVYTQEGDPVLDENDNVKRQAPRAATLQAIIRWAMERRRAGGKQEQSDLEKYVAERAKRKKTQHEARPNP